ncbi:hypothetical protein [Marimonas lutisalis]|uniref:hypothetical protein n=1 Tax=Marimonas lutisalis TaxID=2545756 RepID=UPI0010F60C4C|nr:hypothetical protein [Marimonas lutisalis]
MLNRLVALGLGIGAVLTAIPAHAENCAMRDQVVQRLEQDYAEQLTGGGLNDATDGEAVVEVWASPETGTFTVLMTTAEGLSCVLATGTDWFAQSPVQMPAGLKS